MTFAVIRFVLFASALSLIVGSFIAARAFAAERRCGGLIATGRCSPDRGIAIIHAKSLANGAVGR